MTEMQQNAATAAERIVLGDLQYVYPAMRREVDRYLVLQYCCLLAFETRSFYRVQLGRALNTPASGTMVRAARHSVKFLGDAHRPNDLAVEGFEALIAANRAAFFPPDRPRPDLDWLRSDLSVMTVAGVPLMSSVSAYYGLGLAADPSVASAWQRVGGVARDVGWEVGDLVRELVPLDGRSHLGPMAVNVAEVEWLDGDTERVYPAMFGGAFAAPETAVLSALTFTVSAAVRYARSDCCLTCHGAGFKQRLTVLWHAVASLVRLSEGSFQMSRSGYDILKGVLALPEVTPFRDGRFRALRNGLVHLGLSDLPHSVFDDEVGVQGITEAYTGIPFDDVERLVDDALTTLSIALQRQCVEPAKDGRPFLDWCRPAPV